MRSVKRGRRWPMRSQHNAQWNRMETIQITVSVVTQTDYTTPNADLRQRTSAHRNLRRSKIGRVSRRWRYPNYWLRIHTGCSSRLDDYPRRSGPEVGTRP